MKIVIKIQDKLYDLIKHYERSLEIIEEEYDTLEITLMRAIINGTPLPEHHGDLIDRSEISIPYDICDGDEAMGYVNEVSAIVEADKEKMNGISN